MHLPHLFLFIQAAAVAGVIVFCTLFARVRRIAVDNPKAAKIAAAIKLGALTFLNEEYRIIAGVALIVAALLGYFASPLAAGLFLTGAALSLLTGYIGMQAATDANVRTTLAAKNSTEREAFFIALFGGGVMGFAVASFGLAGLGTVVYLFAERPDFITLVSSFGVGASLVAFFARVGGGIYTKSADIGADLVGKLEAGIPEDDPRNPAVIADNVGDCVGDTAGMGADIYESYVTAMISAIILAMTEYPGDVRYTTLPLMISACGLFGSIIGIVATSLLSLSPASLLRYASYSSVVAFLACAYGYIHYVGIAPILFGSLVLGCVSGIAVGLITEYYTGMGPIRRLAQISESGAATNLIYGLSIGLESAVAPVMILGVVVWIAYSYCGGLLGVALAAVAMLATVGITMTVDAYGPIADNAGGIAEMAGFGPEVRKITDKFDALGNTTAAMGKGFAIGSALLAALGVFVAYADAAHVSDLSLTHPVVIVGLFIGGTIPFWISALTMRSVGNAALKMVMEVRRQFRDIKGLMSGEAEPDYRRCIAISTQAALHEMLLPGLITIASPVVMFFTFGTYALGGFLVGATLSSVLLALMMANGGGAWDNAKKYIEAGHHGGKGSDAHRAAVVGDTVGDPFKDTSGPALNILIKLMSMIALLLVSL